MSEVAPQSWADLLTTEPRAATSKASDEQIHTSLGFVVTPHGASKVMPYNDELRARMRAAYGAE